MTIYYVSDAGNDSNVGTSMLSPWKTINKVRGFSFSTGDQVYFRCGDTFTPSAAWVLNFQGTSANKAIIGAYHPSGFGVSGIRPILSGSNYSVPANITNSSHDSWQGLIQVSSKDYVHIKDLIIQKSGWYGINMEGNLNLGTRSAHFLVKNVKTDASWHSGISVNKNKENYGTIEDCEVTMSGWRFASGAHKMYPASLAITASPYSYTTIKRNYVHRCWGEGIGVYKIGDTSQTNHSGYATVEDNVVYNIRSNGIYIGSSEYCVVRRNVLIGASSAATGGTYYDGGGWARSFNDGRFWNDNSLGVAMEPQFVNSPAHNNILVYNNLIVGCGAGLWYIRHYGVGTTTNIKFFNNTVIANRSNLHIPIHHSKHPSSGVEFKNNIFYSPGPIGQDFSINPQSWWATKFNFSHNAWTAAPAHINTNSIIFDGRLQKTTGWQNLSGPIDPNLARKLATCNAIDAGVTV